MLRKGTLISGMRTSLCVVSSPEISRNVTITSGLLTSLCFVSELKITRNGTLIFGVFTSLCVVSAPEMTRKGTITSGYANLTLRCKWTGNDEEQDEHFQYAYLTLALSVNRKWRGRGRALPVRLPHSALSMNRKWRGCLPHSELSVNRKWRGKGRALPVWWSRRVHRHPPSHDRPSPQSPAAAASFYFLLKRLDEILSRTYWLVARMSSENCVVAKIKKFH